MAKKKNQTENVYIVDQELRPTVIGVVDETEKKPIFLIVIFIILVLVLFGLPYLTDMYTNLKSGTVSAPKTNTSNNNKKEENEVPQTSNDEPFYLMASNNPIKYDLVEISNLQFSQLNNKSYINFNLKNTSDKAFNITKQNYYLELYNSEKTLLERIKVLGNNLEINSSSNQLYEIKNTSAVQIKFLKKTVEDYPAFELSNTNGSITCKKDNETFIYKFKNNKLNNITEIYSYNASSGVFANVSTYKNKVSAYNALPGVTAQVSENASNFEFKADIDLSKTKIASLNNEHFYELDTLAKTVHFEMDAMGYTCN